MNHRCLLLQVLKPCPRSGTGVHRWAYGAAATALELDVPEDEAAPIIREMMTRAENPPGEVEAAFRGYRDRCRAGFDSSPVQAKDSGKSGLYRPLPPRPTPRWPEPDRARIQSLAAAGPTMVELWKSSPVALESGKNYAEEIIDRMFPGNPWLCVGWDQSHSSTEHREVWRGRMAERSFLVPSPMRAKFGRTQAGHMSQRSLRNVGPRRFLLIEADSGSFDQQCAILRYLSTKAPLALAVYSGGKSIHGFFYCAGQPEESVEKFMQEAVSLGADEATWSPIQLVRVPDGRRLDWKPDRPPLPDGFRQMPENCQSAFYFAPEVLP